MKTLEQFTAIILLVFYIIIALFLAGGILDSWKNFALNREDFWLGLPYLPLAVFAVVIMVLRIIGAKTGKPSLAPRLERAGHIALTALWLLVMTVMVPALFSNVSVPGGSTPGLLVSIATLALFVHLKRVFTLLR